jgi:hypothetical protein
MLNSRGSSGASGAPFLGEEARRARVPLRAAFVSAKSKILAPLRKTRSIQLAYSDHDAAH